MKKKSKRITLNTKLENIEINTRPDNNSEIILIWLKKLLRNIKNISRKFFQITQYLLWRNYHFKVFIKKIIKIKIKNSIGVQHYECHGFGYI